MTLTALRRALARSRTGTLATSACLLVALVSAIWNYVALDRAHDRLATENELTIESERLLSMMKDLETGERGFLLVGREEYLEPYVAALAQVPDLQRAFRATSAVAGVCERDRGGTR